MCRMRVLYYTCTHLLQRPCTVPAALMLSLLSSVRHTHRIVQARQGSQIPISSLVFYLFARLTYESLTALEIPNDMLQIIQDLILDLRIRCIMVTLQHTAEGILVLLDKVA